MSSTWGEVVKLLPFLKPYWKKSLLSLALLVAVVLMDLAIPRLVQRIIDQGIYGGNLALVAQTTLVMLALSLFSTLFAIGNNNTSVQVGESVARDVREALFMKMQSFSFGNLDRLQTGGLMVRLTSDTSVVQRLVQVTLRIGTRAPLLMIGSLILMFQTDQRLALTMLPLLAVTAAVLVFFVARMGAIFGMVQEKLDRLNTILQENIAGVRVVKAFVRDEYEERRFASANQAYTDYNVRVMQFMSSIAPALTVFINLGVVMVIWAGGLQAVQGEVTIGQIVAFVNYLQTTLGPLTIMAMLANVWALGLTSARRVNEVLDTAPEVQDAPNALPLPMAKGYRVVFENVGFSYDGARDSPVLAGINLQAEAGQTLAILGATGAGKTTLVNLIPRFYEASSGRIMINGMDIRSLRQESLLERIGIAPQEAVLFSGSVRENICYGRPEASQAEMIAAAQIAQAHDFILELPQGYDTHIEQRGVNLSGGQKQRIAIARALLTRPSILILDDSTSSVDVETETRIQQGLAKLQEGCTTFVVAQRISTVLKADKIVVLEKGRIAAQGTHAELLASSTIYQEIYASQLGAGAELETVAAAPVMEG